MYIACIKLTRIFKLRTAKSKGEFLDDVFGFTDLF